MSSPPLRTPCHSWHVDHGGRMVDFAGWEMPVQYSSIVAEHQAVRTAVGLFDISHMGRLEFSGPDAVRFLNFITTNNVRKLDVGEIQYSLIVNERGGILDDILVYRFPDNYLMVVNASNREKILNWIGERRDDYDFSFRDLTASHCMLALQGPQAETILNPLVDIDLKQIRYYRGAGAHALDHQSVLVSRTGYTGEDGFEVIIPADYGIALWETLMQAGADYGILPCGLGCRDTLRLEAAMPLYGHEMDEEIDPYTAGLGFAVKLDKPAFVGQQSLAEARQRTDRLKRIGLELEGKRIAREGALLFSTDRQVGRITSGTFSPTFEKPLAMGYLPADLATPGTNVDVDIRGSRVPAQVVSLPFYRRTK